MRRTRLYVFLAFAFLWTADTVWACPGCTISALQSKFPEAEAWTGLLSLWGLALVIALRVSERKTDAPRLLDLVAGHLSAAFALAIMPGLMYPLVLTIFCILLLPSLAVTWWGCRTGKCRHGAMWAYGFGAASAIALYYALAYTPADWINASLVPGSVGCMLVYFFVERKQAADWLVRMSLFLAVLALPWLVDPYRFLAFARWSEIGPKHLFSSSPLSPGLLWNLFQEGLTLLTWLPVICGAGFMIRALVGARRRLSFIVALVSFGFSIWIWYAGHHAVPGPGGGTSLNAIAALKQYATAQETYKKANYSAQNNLPPRQYAPGFRVLGGDNAHKSAAGNSLVLLPDVFAAADNPDSGYSGYYFVNITVSDPASEFGLCAVPCIYGDSGTNTFIINQVGVIYYRDTKGKPVTEWPADEIKAGKWIVP